MVALSKSQNKHNRLYAKAEPLSEEVSQDIESGKVAPRDDFKLRARYLADEVSLFYLRLDLSQNSTSRDARKPKFTLTPPSFVFLLPLLSARLGCHRRQEDLVLRTRRSWT